MHAIKFWQHLLGFIDLLIYNWAGLLTPHRHNANIVLTPKIKKAMYTSLSLSPVVYGSLCLYNQYVNTYVSHVCCLCLSPPAVTCNMHHKCLCLRRKLCWGQQWIFSQQHYSRTTFGMFFPPFSNVSYKGCCVSVQTGTALADHASIIKRCRWKIQPSGPFYVERKLLVCVALLFR